MEASMKTFTSVIVLALAASVATAQWVQTNGPYGGAIHCFAVSGTNLFAGADGSGVFLSTNNGTIWTSASTGLTNTHVHVLDVAGMYLFAGTESASETFLSTNNGAMWSPINGGLGCIVSDIVVKDSGIFAAGWTDGMTDGGGVYVSTTNGTSWSAVNEGLPYYGWMTGHCYEVFALAVKDSNLYAASGGVYVLSNNGSKWTPAGLTNEDVSCFAVNGKNLFAGKRQYPCIDTGDVFLSTDDGASWTDVSSGLTNAGVNCLAVSGTNLFAGSMDGVFLLTSNGPSWFAVNTGLNDTIVYSLAVSGTYLFAGTGSGVWRRPLSEMTTDLGDMTSVLPNEFVLFQNYPNPFNPSTTIKYKLPKSSEVSLSVIDMLGRKVSVLVHERMGAGVHEAKFDGSDLASGMYFYRLQAGDYVQTKKLMVVK